VVGHVVVTTTSTALSCALVSTGFRIMGQIRPSAMAGPKPVVVQGWRITMSSFKDSCRGPDTSSHNVVDTTRPSMR
jgi:hypothetical protein